jgi:hypothetical protein
MQLAQKECGKDIPLEEMAKFITDKKSVAVGALYAWCDATIKCYDINKTVEPKK